MRFAEKTCDCLCRSISCRGQTGLYASALFALARFLARQSGRAVDDSDKEAIKSLSEIDTDDVHQVEKWLDAYYRDVV